MGGQKNKVRVSKKNKVGGQKNKVRGLKKQGVKKTRWGVKKTRGGSKKQGGGSKKQGPLPGTPPHRLHSAARLSTSCRGHAKRWEAVGTALLKWLSPNMRPHVILKPFEVLVIQ